MVHSVVVGRILAALFVVLHLGMILDAEHGEYDEEHQAEDERDEGRGAHRHEPARIFLAAAGDAASNGPKDVRQEQLDSLKRSCSAVTERRYESWSDDDGHHEDEQCASIALSKKQRNQLE